MAALAAEIAAFLGQAPAGEELGAKLNRLLFGFLETEILPQATRRLSWASTRCRGWTIVAAVFRLYADALERPNGATY